MIAPPIAIPAAATAMPTSAPRSDFFGLPKAMSEEIGEKLGCTRLVSVVDVGAGVSVGVGDGDALMTGANVEK